jgi:hypothetical protein
MPPADLERADSHGPWPSWGTMLLLILCAILLAAGLAYLLVHPYFRHTH